MIDFVSYFKVAIFFCLILITGIVIVKRAISETRAQLVLPTAMIVGVGVYIFLINLLAHLVKGGPLFYLALLVQIIIASILHFKVPTNPIKFPQGKERIFWIISLIFWAIFLYQITAHSIIDGADSTIYYSLAARFSRGDYPIHNPTQPDYIAFNHIGGPMFLGAAKTITGASYYFLHASLAFLMFLSISQILTWIFERKINNFFTLILASLPAVTGIITLGSFMFAFPVTLQLPSDGGILNWLQRMPTLTSSFEPYGAPTDLDNLILFLHRFLSISLLMALLVPMFSPKNKFTLLLLAIMLAALALVDESVFLVAFMPVLMVLFFTIFKKSVKRWLIFSILLIVLILSQGGIITETLLNRYSGESQILFFPLDGSKESENYRSYRLNQQENRLFTDKKYVPLGWFHPAIYLQIFILFIITIIFSKNLNVPKGKKILLWTLFFSSLISFIAYHAIVPKGYAHFNGNRFLALSFYLSGIGITFYISWLFETNFKNKLFSIITKGLLVGILITSIVPPLIQLFPRKKDNFLKIIKITPNPVVEWIKSNIDKDKRFVALIDPNPIPVSNIFLIKEAGILSPFWSPKPRVHDSFDFGPTYSDFYYTLNPEATKSLGVNFIMISKQYRLNLSLQRQSDLNNTYLFKPIHNWEGEIIIYEIQDKYLAEGKNLEGSFAQLEQIAPKVGKYYIDSPPNISENVFRILRLLLYDREVYCDRRNAFYNSRIDIDIDNCRENSPKYDYLLLGENVDPKSICNCEAISIWQGLGTRVNFWKVNSD